MPTHAILADDLTGAADTGVQFAMAGIRTSVDLGGAGGGVSAELLVVTTDSRAAAAHEAARAVEETVRRLRDQGVTQLYKKIDSTCRGNLAVEIDAALRASEPNTLAVVCPAFIAAGRTVVGGYLLVQQTPVDRTPIGDDPVTPVTTSSIPAMLASLPGPVAHIDLVTVTAGHEAIRDALRDVRSDAAAVVVDAASEQDLTALAEALQATGRRCLPVGSAGLARALAPTWAAQTAAATSDAVTLVVVGSMNDTSRAQADVLCEVHRWPRLTLDLDVALGDDARWRSWISELGAQALDAVGQRPGVVLTTPLTEEPDGSSSGPERGMDAREVAATVADRLAAAAIELCDVLPLQGIVLTGGDTARAILARLETAGISLTGEVMPGMPAGRLVGGMLDSTVVVTKAGGFGDGDALLLAARHAQQVHNDHRLVEAPPPRDPGGRDEGPRDR